MASIELVLCDVGNVLVLADTAITFCQLEANGVQADRAQTFFKNDTYYNFSRGLISPTEAYRLLIRDQLDEGLSYQQVLAAHDAHITGIDRGVEAVLSYLKIPLAFATDTNAWQTARVAQIADLRQFSDLIIKSDDEDIQSLKTDPGVWQRIFARLGVDPAKMLFIDDSPPKITAAQAAGLGHTIHFENAGQLFIELHEYGAI